MKQRNIMAVIFLSILTLGIYDLFWLVKVKKELNEKTSIHTPSLWVLFAPFIALAVGLIVALVTMPSSASDNSATITIVMSLVYGISILAILPISFYWFFKFSKAVGQYTNGQLNTAVTFILLWILRFIGLAVVQDHFNDMLAAGTTPGGTAVAGQMPDQSPDSVPTTMNPVTPSVDQSTVPAGAASAAPAPNFEQPAVMPQSFDPTQPSTPVSPAQDPNTQSPTDPPQHSIQ